MTKHSYGRKIWLIERLKTKEHRNLIGSKSRRLTGRSMAEVFTVPGPQYDIEMHAGGSDEAKKRRVQGVHEDERDPTFNDAEVDQSSAINDRVAKPNLEWGSPEDIKKTGRFNNDTIQYLGNLSESNYSHQKVYVHIQRYVEEEVQNEPQSYIHDDKEKLKDDLSYLAFTDDTAKQLVQFIPDKILSTQNAAYWASNFTENWILSDQSGPNKRKEIQNSWVSRNFQVTYASRNGPAYERELKVYYEQERRLKDADFWDIDRSREQFFFHGTSKDDVDGIIRNGLALSGGPFGQDFSCRHRPGFYLSDKLSNGRLWAQAKAACPAIIVLKVPKEIFSNVGLDLLTREDDFQREVYLYNRSGGEELIGPETEREIENSKIIRGPALLNPKELFGNDQTDLHLADDSQLCILDEDVAAQFYDCIHGVVYCEKQVLEALIVE